jgi:hypothetical protein
MEWQDAAGLAQLSQSVEDVFSSGPGNDETLLVSSRRGVLLSVKNYKLHTQTCSFCL